MFTNKSKTHIFGSNSTILTEGITFISKLVSVKNFFRNTIFVKIKV